MDSETICTEKLSKKGMMKPFLTINFFVSCALIIFSFHSCSNEEDDPSPTQAIVQTPVPEPTATQYTLTVSASEGGTISTEGGTYDEGSEITITATPNEGYEFTSWEGSESVSSSLNITLNANTTLQALFSPLPTQYTLTISANKGGAVSTEGGTYDEGTEITATATPDEGYRFLGWEGFDNDEK